MNPIPIFFGTPWPVWSILLAGAGAGYLTWRGYANRAAEIQPSKLNWLKILRFAAWGLLFLCILQPMSRQYISEDKASRLTVLLDDSESMAFTDTRNGPTRMARVKSTLVGEAALAQAVNSTKDPKAAKPNDPIPPDKDALLGILSKSFTLQMEAFGPATRTLSQTTAYDAAMLHSELQALGDSTDVARALTESLSRLKGPDAGGLVIISDGADTARGEIERIAAQYKRLGIPIYALGVGAANQPDLSITQVRCRRNVSKDTLARVEIDVRGAGLPDGKHKISIERKGKAVATQEVDLKNELGTVIFEILPDSQGFLEYEAKVEPFPGELVTANNVMAFGLVAYSRKLKVLYMEGSMYLHSVYNSTSPGMYSSNAMQQWWEHQFLERAITEDLDVEMDFLSKDPYKTPRGATPIEVKSVKEGGFPTTKKELYQYDVIISSDIPFKYFTAEQIQMQVDFVGKHGGGFAMVGGYDAFGEGKYAKTAIDRMLPVEMNASDDHEDDIKFNWKITDEAWRSGPNGGPHPIMLVDKDEEKSRAAWERLPAFHGFSKTTRPKPAATTLAVVANEEYETAYGPAIVLAVQQYGNGRSLAFTTDTTGSWGTEWEDSWGPPNEFTLDERNRHYKNFWKNAVRWLAHYRMQAPNQLVRIETDRLVYGRGEIPEVRIKVLNEDIEPTHKATVSLTVTGPDGVARQMAVYPKYEEPGIYERKLELNGVGRYEIEAVATIGKEELGRDKSIFQVRPASAEMRQTGQNIALLKTLAELSGGKYFPLEKAGDLPKSLRDATHTVIKHRDVDLWDRWWLFALTIALLCAEWFYRKRYGLP